MPNYAIHNGSEITNVIVALSLSDAEALTGDQAFEITGSEGINWVLVDNVWYPPKPFASWTLNNEGSWVAPTPKPEGDWKWNEYTLSWDIQTIEE